MNSQAAIQIKTDILKICRSNLVVMRPARTSDGASDRTGRERARDGMNERGSGPGKVT